MGSVVTQNSFGMSLFSLTTVLNFIDLVTLHGLVCKIKSSVNLLRLKHGFDNQIRFIRC
jgi:hypothetical protein